MKQFPLFIFLVLWVFSIVVSCKGPITSTLDTQGLDTSELIKRNRLEASESTIDITIKTEKVKKLIFDGREIYNKDDQSKAGKFPKIVPISLEGKAPDEEHCLEIYENANKNNKIIRRRYFFAKNSDVRGIVFYVGNDGSLYMNTLGLHTNTVKF